MKKILVVSSLLFSSLLADNSLGQKISIAPATETIVQTQAPLRTRVNPNQQTRTQEHVQQNRPTQLQTRVAPKNIKKSFKKDHHRYDKRYSNFDYDRNSYYNNDGYYYGYYDTTGYFYNNIFFDYDNTYTYNDRYYRRGHFRPGYNHRRHYVHHTFNDWNRVHCYREPNVIVSGHYYNRSHYPQRYNNHYRSPSRMNVTRMNGRTSQNTSRNYNNRSNYSNRNNSYRSNMSSQPRRSTTRMTTRGSSSSRSNSRHMGMSK
ncbi:MAG TPA: hypothetical protein EYG94_05945 [Campylobacterales bacterium]|nr:hypothetical protein [Campylobacterales bacterium]